MPGEAGRTCWCSPWGLCCEFEFRVMSMLREVVTGSRSEGRGSLCNGHTQLWPFWHYSPVARCMFPLSVAFLSASESSSGKCSYFFPLF